MVLEGAVSMRAAARISGLIAEATGGHRLDALSHTTVQNYLLRIGLDQITDTSEVTSDGVWVMDHMIAAGSLKCFIVLSISAEVFAKLCRPIEHRDVNVLALIPTKISNGTVVCDQLSDLATRHGAPLAILSDCGSDLKKGVENFQVTYPETISLDDIVHLVSRLIWKRLDKEERFSEYRQACYRCANKLRQSPLAHLKPPRPKTKARYMNLDPEIRWGERALWLLDRVRAGDLTDRQRNRLDHQSVEDQLGWLDEYRDALDTWTELAALGRQACSVVRRAGYSLGTTVALKETLGMGKSAEAQEMIDELVSVVSEQCRRCEGQQDRQRQTSAGHVAEQQQSDSSDPFDRREHERVDRQHRSRIPVSLSYQGITILGQGEHLRGNSRSSKRRLDESTGGNTTCAGMFCRNTKFLTAQR